MASEPEELEAAALALPREERAHLAKQLIASLDEEDEIDQAWRAEVRRRLEAYRDDQLDSVPADEVFDDARGRTDS